MHLLPLQETFKGLIMMILRILKATHNKNVSYNKKYKKLICFITKCAPCSTKACARDAGQGLAKAAKCSGLFP
jgi:hypothetical protein